MLHLAMRDPIVTSIIHYTIALSPGELLLSTTKRASYGIYTDVTPNEPSVPTYTSDNQCYRSVAQERRRERTGIHRKLSHMIALCGTVGKWCDGPYFCIRSINYIPGRECMHQFPTAHGQNATSSRYANQHTMPVPVQHKNKRTRVCSLTVLSRDYLPLSPPSSTPAPARCTLPHSNRPVADYPAASSLSLPPHHAATASSCWYYYRYYC